MKELLHSIYDFLVANDSSTILASIRKLEWDLVLRSFYTWLIALPIVIYFLWTRKYKYIAAIGSCFLFLLLIQKTLTPTGETLPLHDLLLFLSGTVIIIGVNLYLIFVK